jgi:hypothetical protein
MSDLPPRLARMPSTADVTPPLPGVVLGVRGNALVD